MLRLYLYGRSCIDIIIFPWESLTFSFLFNLISLYYVSESYFQHPLNDFLLHMQRFKSLMLVPPLGMSNPQLHLCKFSLDWTKFYFLHKVFLLSSNRSKCYLFWNIPSTFICIQMLILPLVFTSIIGKITANDHWEHIPHQA